MGYCYEGGKLVCDRCSNVGGVRMRKCPSGYCGPHALCGACWTAVRPGWAVMHSDCAASSAKVHARWAAEAASNAAGDPVLTCRDPRGTGAERRILCTFKDGRVLLVTDAQDDHAVELSDGRGFQTFADYARVLACDAGWSEKDTAELLANSLMPRANG